MKTQRLHPLARRILRITALLVLFVAMSGSRASCEMTSPDVIVVDDPHSHYSPPPVMYTGDISVNYDFGGYSCWEMGIETIEFSLSAGGPNGPVIAEDWGLGCDPYGEIYFPDMQLDTYYLTLIARDHWGHESFWYESWVYHEGSFTGVDVSLY